MSWTISEILLEHGDVVECEPLVDEFRTSDHAGDDVFGVMGEAGDRLADGGHSGAGEVFLDEARVRDSRCGKRRKHFHNVEIGVREGLIADLVDHFEHADQFIAIDQGHRQQVSRLEMADFIGVAVEPGVVGHVADIDRRPGGGGDPGDALTELKAHLALERLLIARFALRHLEVQLLVDAIVQHQRAGFGAGDFLAFFHDAFEQRFEVGDGREEVVHAVQGVHDPAHVRR